MKGFACISCGCVNLPRDPMTVERIYPDDQHDREVKALNREINWLREMHRDAIKQLVNLQITQPAPMFIPDPQLKRSSTVTISVVRFNQLLDIEKAAQAIVNPETRHSVLDSPMGTMAGSTVVSNAQFSKLTNAILNVPKDPS